MKHLLLLCFPLLLFSCTQPDYSRNHVILYSREGCDYCEEKHKWLEQNKIPFTEYFINRDRPHYLEIKGKLMEQGKWKDEVHTPALDVNGVVFDGNPGVEEIRAALIVQ